MSTESKGYIRLIPVRPDADLPTLQWLTRESFETTAAAENLHVVAYSDSVLTKAELPQWVTPAAAEKLELRVEDYQWHLFTATAVRVELDHDPDACGYCAPHPTHRTVCGKPTDDGPVCRCPGWPL